MTTDTTTPRKPPREYDVSLASTDAPIFGVLVAIVLIIGMICATIIITTPKVSIVDDGQHDTVTWTYR